MSKEVPPATGIDAPDVKAPSLIAIARPMAAHATRRGNSALLSRISYSTRVTSKSGFLVLSSSSGRHCGRQVPRYHKT